MNSRERVLNTINRQPVDRPPVDVWLTPEVYAALAAHCDTSEPLALYRALGLDKILWTNVPYAGPLRPTPAGLIATQWGSILKMQQAGMAEYGEYHAHALAECETAADIERFGWWPDPAHFDYNAAIAELEGWGGEFVTLGPWVSFFEVYCQMRGLENAMMDLAADPDMVTAGLDRIEAVQTELLTQYYTRLRARGRQVDLAFISDDMGSQQGLLMSLKHWDRHIGPRMARWCALIHGFGMKVLYHSDGACEPLIPRLIDCGIDILNPVQHVCPGMDRSALKAKYGDKLVFHGGVENQAVLPFGTAEDVRQETRECLRTLGAGGGYIVCSCHNVQAGTPVENVLAMIETVRDQG